MAKKYLINGRKIEGVRNAESHLSALYRDMCTDCEIDFEEDAVAWREDFNNWTDMLHKEGSLCDSGYQDLCPVGDEFE